MKKQAMAQVKGELSQISQHLIDDIDSEGSADDSAANKSEEEDE